MVDKHMSNVHVLLLPKTHHEVGLMHVNLSKFKVLMRGAQVWRETPAKLSSSTLGSVSELRDPSPIVLVCTRDVWIEASDSMYIAKE
ncbi:hypothetical protein TNCV_1906731 [Trichonephila clavipes]|nr:hypothetical protein TNCV_1906731 [Trichonephila clavipes]